MSKLARLRLHNFKGKRSEWAIAPKMLLVGPNGAGKSALLQAVMVGILGYEPRLGRTPASVVQLASGREMSVEIETDAKFILHRTFKLSRGAVSTSVWVSPHQGERNLADAHRRIAEEVGDFAVSFDLNAFLSLSDAKKRAFLFGLSPTKGLGWDKPHLKSRLIQAVRAPVSSLTLHAWIDKAFALWTEGHDLQSNFDRMLIYLKKEFSLWSLRKKEGVATARRMLHTRNQEPFVPSEATRTTQREIEEIQERIILTREELAKDEARRKSAEARGREIEGLRAVGQSQHLAHLALAHRTGRKRDRLIQERQPVAHRAVGRARDQGEGPRLDLDPLLRGDGAEMRDEQTPPASDTLVHL